MPMLTLATGNAHKVQELSRILQTHPLQHDWTLTLCDNLNDVEETGVTFAENALLKARAQQPVSGSAWVLAEDSGLIVPALAGSQGIDPFPGIYSNRWLTPVLCREILGEASAGSLPSQDQKNRALLRLMSGVADRRAAYVCAMVVWDVCRQCVISQAEGRMPLMITEAPRGMAGFGYDPITVPLEDNPEHRTTAELSPETKDSLSHRAKAFHLVLTALVREQAV